MNTHESSAMTAVSTGNRIILGHSAVFTLAIACGLAVANLYYNQPLLADIGRSFNISVQQVGFIPTLTQIGYAAGLLFLVPLGDMVERRRLIVTMLGLVACMLVAAAVSPSLTWLSVSSFAIGFTTIVAQLIIPLAAGMTNPTERGKVIGTLMSGVLLGILLARTVSGLVGGSLGWRAMYWIAAGLMVVLTVVMALRLPFSPPESKLSYPQLMQSLVHLVRQQPVLREASLNGALLFAAFSAFWATLVFLLETPPYHFGSQVAGLFGLVGAVGAICAPFVGRLADKRSPRAVVGLAVAITLSGFVIFWIAGTHLIGLAVGVIVMDLGTQAAQISNQTRIYSLVPDAQSRLNTVFMVSYFLGGALGSFLGTHSWEVWQWNGVCGLGLFLLAVAFIAHFGGRRRKPLAV
jgi:predicted MFS family arabinose efflux permease